MLKFIRDLESKRRVESGSGLIQAVIALGLVGVATAGLMQVSSTGSRAMKATATRLDIQDARRDIGARLSCRKTFEAFGSTRPVPCSGGIVLKTESGANLLPANGKLAGWNITARCENLSGRNGLSIYATKKDAAGNFLKDPLNEQLVLDEKSPISKLYEDSTRPCGSFFGTAVAADKCPNPTDVIVGVNFETRELKCEPAVSSAPETYVSTTTASVETCGKTHDPSYATCPSGWIAVSCGYTLSKWAPKEAYQSNAPDESRPVNASTCLTTAGGRPGKGVCFKALANCMNIGKIANSK